MRKGILVMTNHMSDKVLKKMNNDSRIDKEYIQYANAVKGNTQVLLEMEEENQ